METYVSHASSAVTDRVLAGRLWLLLCLAPLLGFVRALLAGWTAAGGGGDGSAETPPSALSACCCWSEGSAGAVAATLPGEIAFPPSVGVDCRGFWDSKSLTT
jgi:hypothetical protein